MAGEFGHIALEKDSQIQCDCENFSCLEALASGNAIAIAAQNELKFFVTSILWEMSQGNPYKISAQMVAEAAKKGDTLAWGVFDRAVEYLGLGIVGLIKTFYPKTLQEFKKQKNCLIFSAEINNFLMPRTDDAWH